MNVYEDNLKTIQAVFGIPPDLLAGPPALLTEVRQTPSRAPTLLVAGRLVHSARDPAREAARLAAAAYKTQAEDGAPAIFALLGFGLGYTAREAARLDPDALILIIERRPEVFRAALEAANWTTFFERQKAALMLNAGPDAVFAALKAAEEALGRPARLIVIKNPALYEQDREWYAALERNIGVWRRQTAINAATQKRFGARWTRNLEANRAALLRLPGVKRLWGGLAAPAGGPFPALLLAAGPSLDGIFPHMEALRQRFVIVAVDTALRFTRRAGIEPDFTLAADPQYWNSRHADRCLDSAKTAYVFETAVYAPLLRPFAESRGRKAFLCASNAPASAAAEAEDQARGGGKGKLAAGGSVATSAWDLCRLLTSANGASGPGELWIAGLDLAFPALRTHYKGAFFEERALSAGSRLKPAELAAFNALHALPLFSAPAAGGGQVKTDTRLSLYAAWFSEAFSRHNQTRHYSLGRGGLAIQGLEPVPVERALAKKPVRAELDAALSALTQQP